MKRMPSTARPNVLVFFTDQQRWDSTGVHHNPLELTPNFDRVARSGTDVHYAFTPQPLCTPARACLQTGLYANTHGCFSNAHAPLPAEHKTLAHYFNDAGYRTGYIGKWHLAPKGVIGAVSKEHRGGYQDWLASNILEFTSDAYQTRLFDENNNAVDLPGYRVDALADATIRYVTERSKEKQPFFLFTSYVEPHHQNQDDDYPAPTGYRERYTGRFTPPDLQALGGSSARHLGGYWGMVKRLDEAFGRVLDALKSLGIERDTIVLFTSDHGNHFRTRNAEYKRSCHESSIRVPTALCGPGFDGGGRVNELVSLIDLPPTLLDAAGIDVPNAMQGRSILPLLRRNAVSNEWPEAVLIQISESQTGRACRTKRWKYGVTATCEDAAACGAERYVEEFLYDLQHDPDELNNLIGFDSHRAAADRMKQRLIMRMTQAGEPQPTIDNAISKPGGQRRVAKQEVDE